MKACVDHFGFGIDVEALALRIHHPAAAVSPSSFKRAASTIPWKTLPCIWPLDPMFSPNSRFLSPQPPSRGRRPRTPQPPRHSGSKSPRTHMDLVEGEQLDIRRPLDDEGYTGKHVQKRPTRAEAEPSGRENIPLRRIRAMGRLPDQVVNLDRPGRCLSRRRPCAEAASCLATRMRHKLAAAGRGAGSR